MDIDGAIRARDLPFHGMLTRHLTRSDFLRPSTVCVRPPPKPGKHSPAWLFAGSAQDACGRKAERMRRFSSNNSAATLAHDVDILCTYPLPHKKDDQALKRICAEHTAVSSR